MTNNPLASLEIAPREVEERLARGDKFLFVDVREKWEYETSHIEGSVLIPLREVPENLPQLAAAGDIVFFCHHGMRSMDAAAWVQSQGIEKVRSMTGGIERWSTQIDPRVPRY